MWNTYPAAGALINRYIVSGLFCQNNTVYMDL